jgi:hypothetical protein
LLGVAELFVTAGVLARLMQETAALLRIEKTRGAKKMTIQKKSLINSLNTTKKALVASTAVAGPAASVKPAGTKLAAKQKFAKVQLGAAAPRFAKPTF